MDALVDERADDINGFYYFTIGFTLLHLVVGLALFVKQRSKFPVRGHNVVLTIIFGLAMASLPVMDSFAELTQADTCTVSTIAILAMSPVVINFLAAQAIRLWFEYNHAEERVKTAQAENGGERQEPGWYSRNHKYFKTKSLIGITSGLSVVELIVGIAIIAALEDSSFEAEVTCQQMLIIIAIMTAFTLAVMLSIVVIFWRFRDKSDGYGIKKQLTRFAIIAQILSPPYVLILIWEAFDDLPYYVASFRVLFDFLAINSLMFVAVDWPVYLSFNEAAQHGLSSISQEPEVEEEEEQVREVLDLASGAAAADDDDAGDIELQEPLQGGDQEEAGSGSKKGASSADAEAPELYSSGTLALGLEEILLQPKYDAQMASFTRHLIGEFNVEGLLFFLRVMSFQKFVKGGSGKQDAATKRGLASESLRVENPENIELSRFSASSGGDSIVVKAEEADLDGEVAWKALLVYFEFLGPDAPAQINVGHRISIPLKKEFEEAIVDFHQLPTNVAVDDVRLKRPLDTAVFDTAQKNVLMLLERDPFVRWRKAIRERLDKEPSRSAVAADHKV